MSRYTLAADIVLLLDPLRIEGERGQLARQRVGVFALDAEDHPRLRLENHRGQVVLTALELRQALVREDKTEPKLPHFGQCRFDVGADTTIKRKGERFALQDLTPGTPVRIKYTSSTGAETAYEIEVLTGGEAAKVRTNAQQQGYGGAGQSGQSGSSKSNSGKSGSGY